MAKSRSPRGGAVPSQHNEKRVRVVIDGIVFVPMKPRKLSARDAAIAREITKRDKADRRAKRNLFKTIPKARIVCQPTGELGVPYDNSIVRRNREMRRLLQGGATAEECNAVRKQLVAETHATDLSSARKTRWPHRVGASDLCEEARRLLTETRDDGKWKHSERNVTRLCGFGEDRKKLRQLLGIDRAATGTIRYLLGVEK